MENNQYEIDAATEERQRIMSDNMTSDGKLKIPDEVVEKSKKIKKEKRKKSNSTPNLKIFVETGNILNTLMEEQTTFPNKYRKIIDIIYENLNRILMQIGFADEKKNEPMMKIELLGDLISMINANNRMVRSLIKNSSVNKDTTNKITKSCKSILKQAIAWRTYTKGQVAEFYGMDHNENPN